MLPKFTLGSNHNPVSVLDPGDLELEVYVLLYGVIHLAKAGTEQHALACREGK